MKMPSMQFYPADWRKDPSVQALGYFERGVWFEILCLMHESSERGVLLLNGLPMPESALARILGLDNQILTTTLTTLLTYGVAKVRQEDGAIYSKRMVSDEKLCKIRREAGKKGGNPILLNQNTTTGVNQSPTPSSSSSSSTSVYIKPLCAKPAQGDFETFWKTYPKKKSKGAALKAWNRLKPTAPLVSTILKSIEVAKSSEDWTKNGGQFVPHPATWLNSMGWEDEHKGTNSEFEGAL